MTGYRIIQIEDEKTGEIETVNWKNCAVHGCKNGVSYALNSIYCHPHSMGMLPVTEKIKEDVSI